MAVHRTLPVSVPLGGSLTGSSLGWLSAQGRTWAILRCISEAHRALCTFFSLGRNLCGENKTTPLYATGW